MNGWVGAVPFGATTTSPVIDVVEGDFFEVLIVSGDNTWSIAADGSSFGIEVVEYVEAP